MTDHGKMLNLISRAWGRGQEGYCFFPWIDREEQERTGERRSGFHEGPAFLWPKDKAKIVKHLGEHENHDLYWCPMLFEFPNRRADVAMDEHALWADLDEADPRQIDPDYEPTMAWETSPGRFQAIWLIQQGDIQGASWPGKENQRLSYYVGADPSGWDTTQLLRVPGWRNHKLDRRDSSGRAPRGKVLWANRRRYLPDDFEELPEVQGAFSSGQLVDLVADEINALDRHEIIARVKLKLNQRARELLYARSAEGPQGSRGDNLWYLIRCLADVGCTVQEIVAVVRETVWNKFEGRADESKRLIHEASKAISQRDPKLTEAIEEERSPKPAPQRLALILKDVRPPQWLVKDILTVGGVGFISGEPKSFKSWFGLDLALSVSTGANFLGHFQVMKPGPVLYIQEEDSAVTLKSRSSKIWKGKTIDKMVLSGGQVVWEPALPHREFDPDIAGYVQQGFVLSEGHWQEWLDEQLTEGFEGKAYPLLLIDTLMNVAGDIEDKAQVLTNRMLKPLKLLSRKHNLSVMMINHMNKRSGEGKPLRGGQRMLGSQAFHAWSEDSLYIGRRPNGDLEIERESKSASDFSFRVTNLNNKEWEPVVQLRGEDLPAADEKPSRETKSKIPGQRKRSGPTAMPAAYKALEKLGEGFWTVREVTNEMGEGAQYQNAHRQLNRLLANGQVIKVDNKWSLADDV